MRKRLFALAFFSIFLFPFASLSFAESAIPTITKNPTSEAPAKARISNHR
ncbi:MAG: hypothetical protein IJ237_06405 [Oscillospiraceae bacterium]|nr:hypothetical protein [Oscillospiraceae bacterium]